MLVISAAGSATRETARETATMISAANQSVRRSSDRGGAVFILSHHDISVATVAAITGKRSFSELTHGDAIKIFLNRVPYGGAAGARLRFFLIASRRSCGAGRSTRHQVAVQQLPCWGAATRTQLRFFLIAFSMRLRCTNSWAARAHPGCGRPTGTRLRFFLIASPTQLRRSSLRKNAERGPRQRPKVRDLVRPGYGNSEQA